MGDRGGSSPFTRIKPYKSRLLSEILWRNPEDFLRFDILFDILRINVDEKKGMLVEIGDALK